VVGNRYCGNYEDHAHPSSVLSVETRRLLETEGSPPSRPPLVSGSSLMTSLMTPGLRSVFTLVVLPADSASPSSCHTQNRRNSVSSKDDSVEKGEADALRRESVLPGSGEEEESSSAAPEEKRLERDHQVNSFSNQRSLYTNMTEDGDRGRRAVSGEEDSPPKTSVQLSCEPDPRPTRPAPRGGTAPAHT